MLSDIILPEGLYYLGKSAFSKCYNIKSVKLPSSLKVLKEKTFYNNFSLQQITIPEGLEEIEHNCFNWCRQMDEVVLPRSLRKLGNSFIDCESLTKVTIKSEAVVNELNNIINKTFKGCYKLKKIRKLIDIETDVYICNDKEHFLSSKGKLPPTKIKSYAFSVKNPLPDYVTMNYRIPDSIIEIEHHAFYNSSFLTSIEIPGTISVIPKYAFAGCTKLKEVIIHEGVEEIEDYAFEGCYNLVKIELPTSLKVISEEAFKGCNNKLKEGMTGIKRT